MTSSPTSPYMTNDNFIISFLVEELSVRGRVVRLGKTVDLILKQHNYPQAISELLGEMVVLVSMLGDMLKSESVVTLQIKSQGVLDCLIADYMAGGKIRAYASFDEEKYRELMETLATKSPDFKDLLPSGFLALTVDPQNEKERYQGIVELEGTTLSECIERYFFQSEQLHTRINLAVGLLKTPGNAYWRAGGILIQQMPTAGGTAFSTALPMEEDNWQKASAFTRSVRNDELLDPTLSTETLLYRLFHEDGVRVYPPHLLIHGCRCSRSKAEAILHSLPKEQLQELQIDGAIIITCQFCGKEEKFPLP